MWIILLLVLFYLLTPMLLIYLCQKIAVLQKLGAVVLAYIAGLAFGNIGLLPAASPEFRQILGHRVSLPKTEFMEHFNSMNLAETDMLYNQIAGLQDLLMTIIIPLAIPLLLFSLDLNRWLKLAKGAMLSLVLAVISLLIAVVLGFYMFKGSIPEIEKVAGMLVGVYTGGTVNLAAIAAALNVNSELYVLTHSYDLVFGAVALLFLMTVAQKLLNTFLPKFQVMRRAENVMHLAEDNEFMENYDSLFKRSEYGNTAKAFLLAVAIFAIGGGLSFLVPKEHQTLTVILTITALGLLASLLKPVNKIKSSFQLGMYLIIVFSLVVSSMANVQNMFQMKMLQLALYVLVVIFGSMLIHVGLSKIFKVDTDTTIIAITALTYSPPFVPAVASALKNRDVIISGLTIGILGYAFGTFLGIIIGKLLISF